MYKYQQVQADLCISHSIEVIQDQYFRNKRTPTVLNSQFNLSDPDAAIFRYDHVKFVITTLHIVGVITLEYSTVIRHPKVG
ncbi:MAG: hypothetical protein U0T81_04680 [Saprospiraceae bacterium]